MELLGWLFPLGLVILFWFVLIKERVPKESRKPKKSIITRGDRAFLKHMAPGDTDDTEFYFD